MSEREYVSDVDEFVSVRDDTERLERERGPLSRGDARLIARMVYLAIKMVLVIDRGNTFLPTAYDRPPVLLSYLARSLVLMVVLTTLMFLASFPLLFIDLTAAAAAFLVSFAMIGLTALLVILTLWYGTRSGGSGPRRITRLAGAVGRLALAHR